MERAACESNPAKHNYHDKRIAVLGHVSAIEAERDRLRAELAECIVALEKIANPISAMKRALPVGATLNGAMATTLSNDPNYLKEIAKAALAARKGEEEGDGHAAR
jgi:hypothetical protein